jgi:hypothetical protein
MLAAFAATSALSDPDASGEELRLRKRRGERSDGRRERGERGVEASLRGEPVPSDSDGSGRRPRGEREKDRRRLGMCRCRSFVVDVAQTFCKVIARKTLTPISPA